MKNNYLKELGIGLGVLALTSSLYSNPLPADYHKEELSNLSKTVASYSDSEKSIQNNDMYVIDSKKKKVLFFYMKDKDAIKVDDLKEVDEGKLERISKQEYTNVNYSNLGILNEMDLTKYGTKYGRNIEVYIPMKRGGEKDLTLYNRIIVDSDNFFNLLKSNSKLYDELCNNKTYVSTGKDLFGTEAISSIKTFYFSKEDEISTESNDKEVPEEEEETGEVTFGEPTSPGLLGEINFGPGNIL